VGGYGGAGETGASGSAGASGSTVSFSLPTTATIGVKYWFCDSADIIVTTGTPTDTATVGHVLLCSIAITSGVMKISQHHEGVITAPVVVLPYIAA
jgi:hypothetical protein